MSSIDIAIILTFLITTLYIGLRSGQRVKSIEDYALGGRNFSTTAIISTIVATWISGSGFFIVLSKIYSSGLSILIASSCMALQIFFSAIFLVPRMGEFLGKLSVAEAMGDMYGKEIRAITAICGIAANVGGIAVQFKVFGTLFSYFLDIPSAYSLYLAAAIVISYSAFGGMRSVTHTDIVQFFTFAFIIPTIGILIWNQFHGLGLSLTTAFENPNFNYREILSFDNPGIWDLIFLMIYFAVPSVDSMDFQRISIGKNVSQVKKAMIYSAIIVILIKLFVAWIPFLIFSINPDLDGNNLLAYIIDTYAYPGLKGLIVVGVAAMAMSTADSRINSSSVLFAHDLRNLFGIRANELLVSKLFSLLLGGVSVYLAMSKNDLLNIVKSSASFYMPIVSVPLILSIFGFRSSKKSVLIGMAGGFLTVLCWGYLDVGIEDDIIPAMTVNLILLFGSHYLLKQKGGWVGIKNKNYQYRSEVIRGVRKRRMIEFIQNFSLLKFIMNNAPKDEKTYSFFGVFCFISNICTIYLTHDYAMSQHSYVLVIYQSMMIIAAFFLLYVMWSERIRNDIFVSITWNLSLIYILVICSTFFVLLSQFGKLQLVVFTLNLMVLLTLSKWQVSLIFSILGVYIGSSLFKFCAGIDAIDLSVNHDSYANLVYVLIISATALIAFLKPKQEYVEATEKEKHNLAEKNESLCDRIDDYSDKLKIQEKEIARLSETAQRILNNVNHELRLPVGNVQNFAEMLSEGLEKYNTKQLRELSDEVIKNSSRLSSMVLNMLDLATLNSKKIKLEKRTANLSALVEERAKRCYKLYKSDKPIHFKLDIEAEILMQIDSNYIRQTIDNLVINAINYSEVGTIHLSLKKEDNSVIFEISDEGVGIPMNELYTIFEPFIQSSTTTSKAEGRGVGLALCKAAIEAHGGLITAESSGVGATFRFILPTK